MFVQFLSHLSFVHDNPSRVLDSIIHQLVTCR